MKLFAPLLGFLLFATTAIGQSLFFGSCPTNDDLENGIVVTDPARVGDLSFRYRKLDGPYFGKNYVNGIFADGMSISYAGLFIYKHWKDGKIIQYEELQVDLTNLLRFEIGTTHPFESVRYNPSNPSRMWETSAEYRVDSAPDFQLGECTYSAVRLRLDGTLYSADGKVIEVREDYTFLPELLLRVSGTGIYWGDISHVKNKTILDGRKWSFSSDAADVLRE